MLFPVRFLFTAATGRVAANTEAADFYRSRRLAPAAGLVTAALAWREQPPTDTEAAAALVGQDLIPLYLQYIDDHTARLAAAGHDLLADRFRGWRTRLER